MHLLFLKLIVDHALDFLLLALLDFTKLCFLFLHHSRFVLLRLFTGIAVRVLRQFRLPMTHDVLSHLISLPKKQLRIDHLKDFLAGPNTIFFVPNHLLTNTLDLVDKFQPVVLVVILV